MVDTLMAKRGKRQIYTPSVDKQISSLEAQAYVLNITEGFEKAIKQAAKDSKISMHWLDIDFVKVQEEVTRKIIGGKFNEIPEVLNSYVKKACSSREAGKLSPKKFDKFMTELNSRLNVVLGQPMEEMLHNKNSMLGFRDEKINSGPQSYLSNASIQGHVTQARDLGLR